MSRPAIPAPDDVSGWDALFERQEQAVAAANAQTLDRYRPRIRPERAAGLAVEVVTPATIARSDARIIYLHGGGYSLFSARSSLFAAIPLAHELGLELWSIDYPRAPRSKCDRTVEATAAAIRELLSDSYATLLVGDSAGGGLAVATTLLLNERGVQPDALALWSPWCDVSGDDVSHRWLAGADPVLAYRGDLEHAALAYAPPERHRDPVVSPAYGSFAADFPPVLIQCGTREILLSGCVGLYRRLEEAGCSVALDIYEGLYHSFQSITPDIPEAVSARRRVARFFSSVSGTRNSSCISPNESR